MRTAADLLSEGGREAVSTWAVAVAAGVQAPTIYRQFGDMRGLLDKVASHGFSEYLRSKVAQEIVEDLRLGWDLHVSFGLANPAFYKLMYGAPTPGSESTAALEAEKILHGLVQRVAAAGRLRVGVERTAHMIHAAALGVVLTLIGPGPEECDPALSEANREAILSAVTADESDERARKEGGRGWVANRAVALKAVPPEARESLTPGERRLAL